MSAPTDPVGVASLTDEQADALDELVHEQASVLASNAINSGEQVEWLIANGWTTDVIADRLAEMTGRRPWRRG